MNSVDEFMTSLQNSRHDRVTIILKDDISRVLISTGIDVQ